MISIVWSNRLDLDKVFYTKIFQLKNMFIVLGLSFFCFEYELIQFSNSIKLNSKFLQNSIFIIFLIIESKYNFL